MTESERKIKEQLLEDLLERMSDGLSDRIKPKGLAVEVAAPDKSKLAKGLDKAKEVLGEDGGDEEEGASLGHDEDSDEARLLQLLQDEVGEKDSDDELARR